MITVHWRAGWLKTAETMYDPFGEDDEDLEITALLDRHCTTVLYYTVLYCTIVHCTVTYCILLLLFLKHTS